MNLRFVPLFCLGILSPTTTLHGEASLFTLGYHSKAPNLRPLDDLLTRHNRPRLNPTSTSGSSASAEWLWAVPPLRWIWLNTAYTYYAAQNGDGARFRSHAFAIHPDLYVDLFPIVFHLGAGATLVNARFQDATRALAPGKTKWLTGPHAHIAAALPFKWRLGLHTQFK